MNKTLAELARDVASNSYSPYSHFPVGAALRCDDGSIFLGTNVENASYGLTICAERSAACAAIAAGKKDFTELALYAELDDFCYPCGACCQFLAEFNPDLPIILSTRDGRERRTKLRDFFSMPFLNLRPPRQP